MDTTDTVTTLADAILDARRTGRRIPSSAVTDAEPSVAEAYAIQARVLAGIGPAGGFKAGRTSPDDHPSVAPIPQSMIRRNGATFTANELGACGIELEVGFLIDRPLPSADSSDFEKRLRDCVRPCPALEVVDSRFETFTKTPPGLKLADNQLGAGAVIGEPVDDWRPEDLCEPSVTLAFDGKTIVEGPRPVPGGSAFGTLAGFIQAAALHKYTIRPGQIVITGSLSGMDFIEPGTRVEGSIAGLGTVTLTFAPG
ncbi:fumarylacetoacetate hydrolase family protein [Fodinicurvata sp. EGI_FJ10296]|uniref:2-keto-4-pentenoate hydratase n=1 Tax=Fodinicurvata sp. EGI_FJ10296 TaxID=3231908 RepID=UPI003456F918